MSKLRVLYITGTQITAYLIEGRKLLSAHEYSQDEAGVIAFGSDISIEKETFTTAVLTDISEEVFREEFTPHVFGKDRREMLKRRLYILFPNTTWRHSVKQGRLREGRRDDVMLLSAITNTDLIQPWLKELSERKTPVLGIYSVALLSQIMFKLIAPPEPHVLIISQGLNSGLRQNYFGHGHFKVSRLTPRRHLDDQQYADLILSETDRMVRFLANARRLSADDTLHAYVIGEQATHDYLKSGFTLSPNIRYHYVKASDICKQLRISGIGDCSHVDALYSLVLGIKRPANPYATKKERHFFFHRVAALGLHATAIAILASSIVLTGINLFDSFSMQSDIDQHNKTTRVLLKRAQELSDNAPSKDVSGFQIRDAILKYNRLKDLKFSPVESMRLVSSVLNNFPDLVITGFDWIVSSKLDANPSKRQDATTSVAVRKTKVSRSRRLAIKSGADALYQIALLQGTISVPNDRLRQAIRRIEALVAMLREQESILDSAAVVMPLDIRSDTSLDIESVIRDKTIDREFSVRIVMRPAL
ncbi:MAG: hypothetical protein BMS9Abin15_0977 [Gammaproteobacteria bacterium]|nr:MAG: hypothetical protein BMS9Abin15_0977 [Gammaproteobacteria bacterium]